MLKTLRNSLILVLLFPLTVYSASKDEEGIPADNDNSYVFIKNFSLSGESELSFPFTVLQKVNLKHLNIPPCIEVPAGIHKCVHSLCYESAPFGKIYRKVIGKEGNSCKYIERTKGFGGIDCLIPNEYIDKISYLFDKHFDTLYDPNVEFTQDELNSLESTYKNFCKVVSDPSLNLVITIDNKKYVQDELSEIIETGEEAESSKPGIKGEAKPKKTEAYGKPEKRKDPFKSIMFKQDDVDSILEAVQGFTDPLLAKKKGGYTATILDKIRGANVITFYLNSIVYESRNNWVVWLNNYKLGYNAPPAAVSVVSVAPDHAEFKWSTNNLDKASPNWQSKVEQVGENEYVLRENNIRIYSEGEQTKTIHFVLKPNQTFILQTLSVIEGRVQ